jgi:hypothetical protein
MAFSSIIRGFVKLVAMENDGVGVDLGSAQGLFSAYSAFGSRSILP